MAVLMKLATLQKSGRCKCEKMLHKQWLRLHKFDSSRIPDLHVVSSEGPFYTIKLVKLSFSKPNNLHRTSLSDGLLHVGFFL